ncbi:hypothetical protein PMAYCL1PPCAC_00685, partial [Pristionchus mayeri]
LSRVAECTARTPTDIRIYAEKAAFEGQPLRSMINGLQARTKYKLSEITKTFAERCYEERLFFYFCEAVRVCIEDLDEYRALELLSQAKDAEKRTLRSDWEPLFIESTDTLRAKNLDASSIRLSKLSDLWKKRTFAPLLLSLVHEMAAFMVKLADSKADNCAARIAKMIQLPNDVQFIAKGQVYREEDPVGEVIPTEEKRIVLMEDPVTAVKYLKDFVISFENRHHGNLRIVFKKKEESMILKMIGTSDPQHPQACQVCGENAIRPIHTSLEEYDHVEKAENETVLFLGLEDVYYFENTCEPPRDECQITELSQCIAKIYVVARFTIKQSKLD